MFWPVSEALEVIMSWRGVLLVYAAIHLLVCAPVHLLVLPGRPSVAAQTAVGTSASGLPSDRTDRLFILLAIAFSCGAFIFTASSCTRSAYCAAWARSRFRAAIGLPDRPRTGRRAGDRTAVRAPLRHQQFALFAAAVLPLGLGLALLAGGNFAIALLCLVAYGIANGLKAVLRATLPLALFGRAQFGTYLGRLALPRASSRPRPRRCWPR